ncbi:RNA-binding protein pop5 [Dipsacomyces acuminosporus]|nr:RNA-binding protein pop5 [Dipsacomyces acuminosporus]
MVRFKNRYICFEVQFQLACEGTVSAAAKAARDRQHQLPNVSARNITSLIRDQVGLNFGDSGAGHIVSGVQVKYFSPQTRMGIIKVPRDHYQMVWAALTLTTQLNKHPCIIRVWHVSGTIKKSQRAAIRVNRDLIIAWYSQQAELAKVGAASATGEGTLSGLLQESETQISAIDG